MDKAKEISAMWSEIKPQIGEMVRLCHEVESHYEVTADAYQRGNCDALKKHCAICEEKNDADAAYQQGLNDAWDAAGKIVSIPTAELHTMFDKAVYYDTVFRDCTAPEALSKLAAYEEQKKREDAELHRGDEVAGSTKKAVVLNVNPCGSQTQVYDCDGKVEWWSKSAFVKTGRHFPEIVEVLRQLKEGEK